MIKAEQATTPEFKKGIVDREIQQIFASINSIGVTEDESPAAAVLVEEMTAALGNFVGNYQGEIKEAPVND